jgi:hypothetical protein
MKDPRKPIPGQYEADPRIPEEHFVWALRNMPTPAGSIGAVTHSSFLRLWSGHLWKCGFAHRDYLASLADENGNIHVDKLPEQTIKFQEAFRGPHHQFNNAARWVGKDEPDPQPMRLQDVRDLTVQEQHVMAAQLEQVGVIPRREIPQHKAQELNDGGSRV